MTATTFKVRLEPGGSEFATEPNEPILDAALRAGHALPYSCRNGSCGTCKATLRAGTVDYGEYEAKALSPAEREHGRVLLCQARPLSDVIVEATEIAAVKGIPIKTLPARVHGMNPVAHDVMVLTLKLPSGQSLKFLAGQYIDILLRDGQRRSFSLANAPSNQETIDLHIRQVPNGTFTTHVFSGLKDRDLLRFRGPLGIFFLRTESTAPVVLVAGGTGFAPIKAILEEAFARGDTRQFHFYWGARARRDLYMHDLTSTWAGQHVNFRYTPVLSEPRPEDAWTGRVGWVHDAVLADYPDLSDHEVYVSGPPPMVDAIRAHFPAHGLAPDRLYYDSFEFAHSL